MQRKSIALFGVAALVAATGWIGAAGASAQEDSGAQATASSLRDWARQSASSVADAERLTAQSRAGLSASATAGQTLTVISKPYQPRREALVDVGPAGDSAGDFFIFEERVFDRSGTDLVGRDAVRCELGLRTFTCEATLRLNGKGSIRVAGTLFNERDNVFPVTGGTDAYQGVGGQLTVFELSGGRAALVFHLIR